MIYFQITNPYRAAFGITDLRLALIERAQTTLRHVVGARAVQSVIAEREAIAFEIAEIVGDVAEVCPQHQFTQKRYSEFASNFRNGVLPSRASSSRISSSLLRSPPLSPLQHNRSVLENPKSSPPGLKSTLRG